MASLLRPILTAIGVWYPVYASFKAMESSSIDDDKQWLAYWIVFSITTLLENIMCYLPGYYVIKCIFLVWLMMPETQGAITVYQDFILPILKTYEPIMDAHFLELRLYIETYVGDGVSYICQESR